MTYSTTQGIMSTCVVSLNVVDILRFNEFDYEQEVKVI